LSCSICPAGFRRTEDDTRFHSPRYRWRRALPLLIYGAPVKPFPSFCYVLPFCSTQIHASSSALTPFRCVALSVAVIVSLLSATPALAMQGPPLDQAPPAASPDPGLPAWAEPSTETWNQPSDASAREERRQGRSNCPALPPATRVPVDTGLPWLVVAGAIYAFISLRTRNDGWAEDASAGDRTQ